MKAICRHILPLFQKIRFQFKFRRWLAVSFHHSISKISISPQNLKGVHHHVLPVFLLSSVVNFNSTLEGDSPSYFAFVLTILILLWNSKTDHHRISILFRMQNEGKKSNSFCKETFPLFHLQLWRFVKFWHRNKVNFRESMEKQRRLIRLKWHQILTAIQRRKMSSFKEVASLSFCHCFSLNNHLKFDLEIFRIL